MYNLYHVEETLNCTAQWPKTGRHTVPEVLPSLLPSLITGHVPCLSATNWSTFFVFPPLHHSSASDSISLCSGAHGEGRYLPSQHRFRTHTHNSAYESTSSSLIPLWSEHLAYTHLGDVSPEAKCICFHSKLPSRWLPHTP